MVGRGRPGLPVSVERSRVSNPVPAPMVVSVDTGDVRRWAVRSTTLDCLPRGWAWNARLDVTRSFVEIENVALGQGPIIGPLTWHVNRSARALGPIRTLVSHDGSVTVGHSVIAFGVAPLILFRPASGCRVRLPSPYP